jgi:4-amino-4-deoxy-L-arabinose transferase-like glycosyltransferase
MRSKTAIAIIFVYAALCFMPGIGRVSLFDRDEPRFAEAAREMIARDSYLVPYFNNEPRLHKPPLIYWVMIGAYEVFGVNEFSARIGSAVAGVLTCFLIYLLARRMFGSSVALLAGLIAASNVLMIVISRAATADSLQLLTLMITFWGFWSIYKGDRRFSSYALLYGGLALGGLAKGPVVISVFLLAALGIILVERRPALLKELKLLPGIPAAAAIVALWLIPANRETNGDFIRVGLGHHVFDRAFSESMEGHSGPFFYYVVLLPLTFAPWFALLPLSLRRMWRAPGVERERLFLFVWAVAPFLLFSFLKTKLPHYILPSFPALAIMTAYGLDALIREKESIWKDSWGKAGIVLLIAAGVGVTVALAAFPFYAQLQPLKKVYLAPVLLLVVLLVCSINDLRNRRNGLFAVDLAGGMVLLVLALSLSYLPAMDKSSAAYVLAEKVRTNVREGDEIFSFGYREPTLVFYAQRPVQFISNCDKLSERLRGNQPFLCIVRDKNLQDIPPDLRAGLSELDHASAYMPTKGKWMSWTILGFHPEESLITN